ncbi:MAG: hypothetical protein U0271_06230 [Polyangiaceae bacterium]
MSKLRGAIVGVALVVAGSAVHADDDLKGDGARASRARAHTLELDTGLALEELRGAEPSDPLLTIERSRALLYDGQCIESAMLLAQAGLEEKEPAISLGSAARGCIRTMAGAVVAEDAASGTWIRFQDDADVALAPYIFDCVTRARETFTRDLGVTMPAVVRIEMVRDQFGLSAMTGLPLAAARTTGTIGIAKWGRVVVVSPRAMPRGYGFLDTIAHELTHLALTRGSQDRAPLWLQEGVARREESRWRTELPFDDRPSADQVAWFGYENKIGPEIDQIGPSIALLPSARDAAVTYAKVESFMGFYARTAGDQAMERLLAAFKDAPDPDKLDAVVEGVTGTRFTSWKDRWRTEVLATAKPLPASERPGAHPPKEMKDARQRYRLGDLLLARDHAKAAVRELDQATTLVPRDATIRGLLGAARVAKGDLDAARAAVESDADVDGDDARWWSIRGLLGVGDAVLARFVAISRAPYSPAIACSEKAAPALPDDPNQRALCQAARSITRPL